MFILRNPNLIKKIALICAAAIGVGLMILLIYFLVSGRTEVAAFTFENESAVKVTLNKRDRVVNATALNKEGEIVLKDCRIKRKKLDVAVCRLADSMGKNGYLNANKNSLLLTSYYEEPQKSQEFNQRIVDYINDYTSSKINISLITQQLEISKEIASLAKKHNITDGKAQFITKILSDYPEYQFKDLSILSVNELNLINHYDSKELDGIKISGKPSDARYVGRYKALEYALSYAEATQETINNLSITMSVYEKSFVYKILFTFEKTDFICIIDANNGQVLNRDEMDEFVKTAKANAQSGKAPDNSVTNTPAITPEQSAPQPENSNTPSYQPPASTDKTPTISREDATQIAFKASGFDLDKIKLVSAEFKEMNSIPCWVIIFNYNTTQCTYMVRDPDGMIINIEKRAI